MSKIMHKVRMSLDIEQVAQKTYQFHIRCKEKGINCFCISSVEPLTKSVLQELGVSSTLIIGTASSNPRESNLESDVLIHVATGDGEDTPFVSVYNSGTRVGGFSLVPLMLVDELICLEVLSLLGYAVTLNGIEYF